MNWATLDKKNPAGDELADLRMNADCVATAFQEYRFGCRMRIDARLVLGNRSPQSSFALYRRSSIKLRYKGLNLIGPSLINGDWYIVENQRRQFSHEKKGREVILNAGTKFQ